MVMNEGIYWVYFSVRNDVMKLSIEAMNEEIAIALAKKKAAAMNYGWIYDNISVCR